jgi:hypothetical protein
VDGFALIFCDPGALERERNAGLVKVGVVQMCRYKAYPGIRQRLPPCPGWV